MTGTTPALVGREAEVAALVDALDQAADGSPATVLVGGEAGVGKTRLVQELTARRGDRARILVGGCVERGADGLPFAPFTAALRTLVTSLGSVRLADLFPAGRPGQLPRVLPGLGQPDTGDEGDTARAQLFEQLLTLLANLAGQRPTTLVIEDAHWAAASSRDLLDFLVRNQQATPGLALIVTYRSDELTGTHPLRTMLAELDRIGWVARRELGRLSRGEVGRQLRGILGHDAGAEFVDHVYRRSQGNPLFVEALVAGGADAGAELPESLRDLLLAPVARLPADARDVVRLAAVGGVRISHDLLAAVSGLDAAALSDALRAAVSANTLVTDGRSYEFRHSLVRDAVYDDLLPGDRVRMHLHYAEALEAEPDLAPDGRAAIELAHHWHAAQDRPRALAAAWHAAGEAEASLAFAEQLRMLTRVLELWPTVAAPLPVDADRATVLEHAVEAACSAGEAEQGVDLTTAAFKELDGDSERIARLLVLRSESLRSLGRDGDLDDLRDAVRVAPPDGPAKAKALAALAGRLMDIPRHDEARRVAVEALEMAATVGEPRAKAHALMLVATLGARFGQLVAELPRLHEAQRLAGSINATDLMLRAIHTEAHLLEAYGEHERAVEVGRDGIAAARETRMARSVAGRHAFSLADSLTSLGRWDEALRVIDETFELLPPPLVQAELMLQRAAIALARGDVELPRNALNTARSVTGGGANIVFPMVELEIGTLLLDGDVAGALAAVERAMAELDLQGATRFVWPFLVAGIRAAAHAADDDRKRADAVLERARSEAESLPAPTPVQRAHRDTFAAEMGRAAGRPDRGAWSAAVAAWEWLGQPYRTAQALLGAAEAAVTVDNDRQEATALLRRAAELSDDLRAAPLRHAIGRLARRARLAVPAADADAGEPAEQARHRLGLTSRELEVLRLVATGRDNHDIAAELFISAKTASVHVSRILAKLGLSNRTEAAATAHRLGLT